MTKRKINGYHALAPSRGVVISKVFIVAGSTLIALVAVAGGAEVVEVEPATELGLLALMLLSAGLAISALW